MFQVLFSALFNAKTRRKTSIFSFSSSSATKPGLSPFPYLAGVTLFGRRISKLCQSAPGYNRKSTLNSTDDSYVSLAKIQIREDDQIPLRYSIYE